MITERLRAGIEDVQVGADANLDRAIDIPMAMIVFA